jgi:DNA primase
MKEEILNLLNMKDILDKYGIKRNKYMFHCPFHGQDKHASAKAYEKSYYCFSCGKNADLIGFVENYFNLNFQEAMEKINYDFGLGLQTRGRIDKNKLIELQKQQKIKKQKEEQAKIVFNQKMIRISNIYRIYNEIKNKLENEMNFSNWEDNTLAILYLENKLELLDEYINKLQEKREY